MEGFIQDFNGKETKAAKIMLQAKIICSIAVRFVNWFAVWQFKV